MQQAEHITESEVDIEKKKQELYSEIDALGIKSDSRINKLKKFLADRKIWHLEEMDYPLRNSYEQYLRGQIRSQIVSFYLKIYDTVKQQHIYQQMQTLNGKRIYEWKYQNKIYFLKYYPEKEIAETFETSYKTNLLVWDFTQNCSEVLKKQIFYTLSRIIANTSMSKAYRNVRLKSLKLLYDSCVQLNITDIGLLEMEQVETILKNFPETSQRSILGECRRDAFMQQEQIQWEANVWYLERLHLGKHRIDESKSLISISFMEVKEIQNREILQAYMKYELGITGQAVSTIVRRFVCIRNFIELLEQEKILAIHATVAEVKKYADGLRERGIQAKGFNERIFGIGHFYKFMEVKQYITRMPFRIEYFQQKEVIVHHDRSVEETVYMEILKKLYLFPERLRCMFLHLWCLGLRASEVCTLKGNAYYQQGEDYWIQVYQVKMKNYKRIPIPQALYQIMKVYLKKHEIQPEEFIFKNSRGGACLYGTFRTQMIEACRENKIANGEYLFQSHDYRHTVATMFYDSHVSLQSIRDYLGHTYEEMTRQYIDYMPQRIAKANDEFFEMQGSSLASWLKKEEKDIIYFSDFPNLQETGTRKDNGKFDLTLLPTQELKEEFRGYIMYRCKNGTFRALIQDRTAYNHIAKFLNSRINRRIKSLGDRNPEKWISLLKGWMLEQGITIVKEKKSVYGTVSYGEAVTILYFRNVLKFLGPEDLRDEIEKDVWELKNLDIKIRSNPIYNVKTLDFRKIYQPDIREECKKAVYMNLQYEAIGTVQGELTIMRIFSEYLQKEYSKIKSCSEIDREVLEEFLIHLSTKDTSHSANSSYVISLRRQLETIGKIYSYERLEHLFINTDIPPEVNAEFRVYSDDEMKRLNAEITQMDVQIARCLLIHQMLGTRISDTLTLRPDCLTRENGQDMIEIYQVKTKRYKKPISKELAKLLQSSIEYTQEKFGDTEYIFVNEKEPDRPMQYMAIKTKVMSMIQEKQLKDDHGELFGFGTHMFRHYYGVKLTEMHLDDWTIARLLGHKRLNNVQHYRKMSNQRMADETREVRQRMSDIIYMSLARWGEEYEQIRQDD
ncbi:tyrosine-type recombinase/integrase [Blautia obeum]|uniref:Tyrosine recombinase XerC n=9 Tax=Bacillota TaxID=1239 RepID=A0A564UTH0_9FIRM|nr:Tyrosine recombinase XerC [Blautia obeum]